jgi:cell division septation protein DedD
VNPSTPWGPYPWEHQPQPDRPSTPWGPYPWEQNPDAPVMPGATPPGGAPPTDNPAAPSASQAFDTGKFLLWLGALAALWLILTALKEAGYPAFAHGMAALVLFGTALFAGPKAIENAQKIFQ